MHLETVDLQLTGSQYYFNIFIHVEEGGGWNWDVV